jgi:hypothetical protein
MEEQLSVNEDAASMSIFDAAQESGTLVEESQISEQQDESTEESTGVEASEESTEQTEGETPEAGETTEDESTEESTEEESSDSDIVDLNNDDTQASTEEESSESTEPTGTNFGEILGGQFEDEEDLTNHLIEQDQRIEELEKAQKTPEFANDYVKRMNEHVLAGGSAQQFAKVQGIDVDNMGTVDLLATELMWNNPELSRKDAEAYLERKFPDSLDEDGNLDPNDVTLKVDATKAAKAIKEIQAEDTLIPQGGMTEEEWNEKQEAKLQEDHKAYEEETAKRMEAWMQPVEDEMANLEKNGVVIPLTDDKGFKFAFDGDEAYKNQLIERVDRTLMDMGTSYKENPKAAKQLMEMFFKNDRFNEIVKAASIKGANSANEEWFKKVHNPSVLQKGDQPTGSGNAVPTGEEALKKIWG